MAPRTKPTEPPAKAAKAAAKKPAKAAAKTTPRRGANATDDTGRRKAPPTRRSKVHAPAEPGSTSTVADAVRDLVASMRRDGGLDTAGEARAAIAAALARTLDDGAGMAEAAVARELRATIHELVGESDGGDDGGWPDFSQPVGTPLLP